MKKIALLLIVTLISTTLFCQTFDDGRDSYHINMREVIVPVNPDVLGSTKVDLKNIKGSPYENESFQSGAIYYGGKLLKDDVLLRYNIFADQFEMKEELLSENMTAIAYDPNIALKLEGQMYVYLPLIDAGDEKGSYYKVITNNKLYNLYKKVAVTYANKIPARTSFNKDVPASFNRSETYFLKSKDGSFTELPNNKNKLAQTLSPKSGEIKKFLKTNNIDIEDEKSLARVVRYYESIMTE